MNKKRKTCNHQLIALHSQTKTLQNNLRSSLLFGAAMVLIGMISMISSNARASTQNTLPSNVTQAITCSKINAHAPYIAANLSAAANNKRPHLPANISNYVSNLGAFVQHACCAYQQIPNCQQQSITQLFAASYQLALLQKKQTAALLK